MKNLYFFLILNMNQEQKRAFDLVISGKNVFITGSAGTGKSFTIDAIREWYKAANIPFGITSSTGISAINIKGKTLHSYLGIGLAKSSAIDLYMKAKKFSHLIEKLRDIRLLVIDEISMISSDLFDKVSEYLQLVRKCQAPFGGIQLVLCGDLFQLPPVNGDFCFKSATWNVMNIETCNLKTIVRQKDDQIFQEILENARLGKCTDEHLELLKNQRNQQFGEVKPTMLYSTNINVDAINLQEYNKLQTAEREYKTDYSKNKNTQFWAERLNIPSSVRLKINTQVMLTVNLSSEDGYVNGTRGMVTEFSDDGPIVLLKDGTQLIITPWTVCDDDDPSIKVSYIPLKLAYALTIHKSQSLTLDAAIIDIGPKIFEYGQAYTALSRVRDLKSVRILNILKTSFKTHPDVLDYFSN